MPNNPTLPENLIEACAKAAYEAGGRVYAWHAWSKAESSVQAQRRRDVAVIAPLIIEWALGEAIQWAQSCSGESADAAADYICEMCDLLLAHTPETTVSPDDHQ